MAKITRQLFERWVTQKRSNSYLDEDDLEEDELELLDMESEGFDLSGLDLSGLDLSGLDLSDCNFTNANLTKTIFTETALDGADFRGASLDETDFRKAELIEAHFEGCNLQKAFLRETILSGAYIEGAIFSGCDLTRTSWGKTDLRGLDFSNCNLEKSDFSDCYLVDCNFESANLEDANFCGYEPADLTRANFHRANLKEANLGYTILKDTNLEESILQETFLADVKYDEFTRWPKDFDPNDEKHGLIFEAEAAEKEPNFIRPTLVIKNHKLAVSRVVLTSDGTRIISASYDNTICVLDTVTGNLIWSANAHYNGVQDLALHPNQSILASAGGDHLIKIWELATGKLSATLKGYTNRVIQIAFSEIGGILLSLGNYCDPTLKAWNIYTQQVLWSISFPTFATNLFAVIQEKDMIAILEANQKPANTDKKPINPINFYSITTGSLIKTLYLSNFVKLGNFSKDGKLFTVGDRGSVRVIETATGKELYRFMIPSQGLVIQTKFGSTNPNRLYVATWDGYVGLIELNKAQQTTIQPKLPNTTDTGFIQPFVFDISEDESILVGSGKDKLIKVYKNFLEYR